MRSTKTIASNHSLKPLEVLSGQWNTEIRWTPQAHKLVGGPATVHGTTRFDWIEDGHFLVQHQGGNGGPPDARLLMGRDDSSGEYSVLYADARGVSRVYRMSFDESVSRIWRSALGFNQRFEGRLPDSRDDAVIGPLAVSSFLRTRRRRYAGISWRSAGTGVA